MTGSHRTIEFDALVGQQIDEVVASWYVPDDTGVHDLVHAWIRFRDLGSVQLHTLNGLVLVGGEPPSAYVMPEVPASVQVQVGTPAPLAALVGGVVKETHDLWQDGIDRRVGIVMVTSKGSVAVADVGDDLAIGEWPDPARWAAAGIAMRP